MKVLKTLISLSALSTLLGFVPLAVNAQQIPTNSIVICSSISGGGTASFKLNGKVQRLQSSKCGTYSGASTFLFYTEYGRNPRYVLERQLAGGGRYDFQQTQSGDLDVVRVGIVLK